MFVSDKCDRAITSVFCCELSLTLMCSALLQKKSVERNFLNISVFYCHAWHKRFAIFLHLLHFCISSLVMMILINIILL